MVLLCISRRYHHDHCCQGRRVAPTVFAVATQRTSVCAKRQGRKSKIVKIRCVMPSSRVYSYTSESRLHHSSIHFVLEIHLTRFFWTVLISIPIAAGQLGRSDITTKHNITLSILTAAEIFIGSWKWDTYSGINGVISRRSLRRHVSGPGV